MGNGLTAWKDPKVIWPMIVSTVLFIVFIIRLEGQIDTTAATVDTLQRNAEKVEAQLQDSSKEVAVLKKQATDTEGKLKSIDEKIDKILERLPRR